MATDPHGRAVSAAQALLSRIPIGRLGEAALQARISQLGINYDANIKPLLGNPLVFGSATQTLSGASGRNFVFAWTVKSASTLRADLAKAHQHSTGTLDGATLYPFSTGTLAVQGSTLIASSDTATLKQALDRHAHGRGMTAKTYGAMVKGLTSNPLVQVFGSLSSALSSTTAANARKVPWVAAIRSYALTASAGSNGLSLQFRMDTSGTSLTSTQLPLASGPGSPSIAGSMPIQVGMRDPAHVVAFFESLLQTVRPAAYRRLLSRDAALRKRTGVDLSSLVGLLTGELIIASDGHATLVRASVSNPAQAKRVLAKLAGAPARLLFTRTTTVRRVGGGFYTFSQPHSTVAVGVVGNQLVAGKSSIGQLRTFAAAPTKAVTNVQAALAFRVRLADLIYLATNRAPSRVEQTILSLLGEVTGWSANSPSALTGSAALGVR